MSSPVSKHVKYVPKHRNAPSSNVAKNAQKLVVRNTVMLSSVAVAATGVAVSGGMLSTAANVSSAAASLGHTVTDPLTAQKLSERSSDVTSRSADRRRAADPAKEAALAQTDGRAVTHTVDVSGDPREIAKALLPEFGYGQDQFPCLDSLYTGESGWRVDADNPTSSAYGIPQALPGSKMASAGPDWATNPETQIRWGLGYIQERYGSPCGALSFKSGHGWY
ncbi:MAG: aggregation-promoting factor C-terminal-like domain-containing protein [Nocardioides sp.]